MIKYLIKYSALSVAILVLTPLLIWFLYSELGQFTIEKEHPAAKDYCQIVNLTKAETGKVAASDLFKLKVEKSFRYPNIDELRIHHTLNNQLETGHFHLLQKSTKIYLSNSTFLI